MRTSYNIRFSKKYVIIYYVYLRFLSIIGNKNKIVKIFFENFFCIPDKSEGFLIFKLLFLDLF